MGGIPALLDDEDKVSPIYLFSRDIFNTKYTNLYQSCLYLFRLMSQSKLPA